MRKNLLWERDDNKKMIVLVGESGSGKSSIEKELVSSFGYEKILIHTTRPIRMGEKEDIDYHFCGDDEFDCREKEGEYLSVSVYNGWRYGIPKITDNDISEKSVFVATPKVLRCLQKTNINNLCSFYINVPRKDRFIRSLHRGDDIEEVYRRSLSDIGQFDGVKGECDFEIKNFLNSDGLNFTRTLYQISDLIDLQYKGYLTNKNIKNEDNKLKR